MTLFAAQTIFFALMTIAICVWCHSVVRALKADEKDGSDTDTPEDPVWADASPDSAVGSRLMRGEPESVSRAIARVILSHGAFYSIAERTAERIVAKKIAPMSQHSGVGHCTEMAFALRRVSDDNVEVKYCFVAGNAERLRRITLWLIFGLGLPGILIGGACVWVFAARSANPIARWQVLQLLQVGHLLWPPFMLIHQHKSMREQNRAFAANLLMQVELSEGMEATTSA